MIGKQVHDRHATVRRAHMQKQLEQQRRTKVVEGGSVWTHH